MLDNPAASLRQPVDGDDYAPANQNAQRAPDARSNRVVVLPGDGIGPEVMAAACGILKAAAPELDWLPGEAGRAVFDKGVRNGVTRDTLDAIAETGVALKGPLETPVGHGGKSVNVTLRKLFELYGNVRPIRSLPGIDGPYKDRAIDLVIVRENVEDLYAGIEHMQTPDVAQCLKLITRPGCEKIARLAFALARAEGRGTVHCATKANIMKLTEGLMKQTFEQVATDYPRIAANHIIIDNCAHRLVTDPEMFDVIVTTNLNGDILSDLAAGLVGGLGLAPSANYGADMAVFEAVHGSAPDIAGRGIANPTAVLQSGIMMLRYLGRPVEAALVEEALKLTLVEGRNLTADLARGRPAASTDAFAGTIIDNMGRVDRTRMADAGMAGAFHVPSGTVQALRRQPGVRATSGVDVFVEYDGSSDVLARKLDALSDGTGFRLHLISNRGTVVHPVNGGRTDCVNHWRCRFTAVADGPSADQAAVLALLQRIGTHLRWMHVEVLERYDGKPAYSLAQGES